MNRAEEILKLLDEAQFDKKLPELDGKTVAKILDNLKLVLNNFEKHAVTRIESGIDFKFLISLEKPKEGKDVHIAFNTPKDAKILTDKELQGINLR